MGKNWADPLMQCIGKDAHISWSDANKQAASGCSPYRCPHCGLWHVGNKTRLHLAPRATPYRCVK
jgi:hypothetical protein